MATFEFRLIFTKLEEAMADDAEQHQVSIDEYRMSLKRMGEEGDEVAMMQQMAAEISHPLPMIYTTT